MDKGSFNRNKAAVWIRLINMVCIIVIIVCLVLIVLPGTAVKSFFDDSDNENSNSSIINRKALPPGSVNETAYFTENYHFDDPIVIVEGLKHFYKLTGIQPYVEIISSDGFYTHRDILSYTRARYSQLFTDESHLLLVVYYDYTYDYTRYKLSFCTVTGSKAKTVIDDEAEKILSDTIESYFNDLGLSEEMFSNAFSDTADRIMGVSSPQSDKTVFIILGALALLALLVWLSHIKKKRKLKEQQDIEMLKKPLEQYGTDTGNEAEILQDYGDVPPGEAEALAKKYAARSSMASAGVKPVSGTADGRNPPKKE